MGVAPSFAVRARALTPNRVAQLARSAAPLAIGVGVAFVLQLTVERVFGPFAAKVLTDIGINVILAVSLNMVNGFTGQFSIGHAGLMAVGGYTAATITYYGSFLLWGDPGIHGGFLESGDLLFLFACLVGGLVAALAGFVVGLPSLRLRGDYLAIVTLGFGEILRVMLQRSKDVSTDAETIRSASPLDLVTELGGSLGFTGLPFYTSLFYVTVFATITLVVAYRIKVSSTGRALLSIREDEVAAEAMGVHTTRLKVTAFVLAAFFAGIAGGLFAHEVGTTLNPRELGFQKSFDIVIMVVLGGMGSISGSALSAALLTILPEALREFASYRMIVYALTLVIMMIVRPQGLFGLREIWDYEPLKSLFRRFK
jgi:branched-chain amino acid transport system permease protein